MKKTKWTDVAYYRAEDQVRREENGSRCKIKKAEYSIKREKENREEK